MATMDEVLQKIAELTQTVKDHKGLAELDREALIKDFSELLKKRDDSQPERKGESAVDITQRAVEQYTGKYARELKNIARDGAHRIGGWELKAIDLLMAKRMIEAANQQKAAGFSFQGVETLKPVSVDLDAAVKALTSTGSGSGDELVPTGMASELWSDFFAASKVAADIPQMPMPTDPFDAPLNFGDVTWYKGAQNTATTATDVATAKSTLTSTEQVAEIDWSYTLDEDAVIAVMPALRARLAVSGGEQMDNFCLNADATATSTGNINLDDDTPASTAWYLTAGQDGIRHQPLVDNTSSTGSALGGAITDASVGNVLNYLKKYGLDYDNCRIVPGVETYLSMLGACTNIATVDKYGPAATIVKGELAKYRGIPVIPSASMPLTEADGKKSTTAGNNTKGCLVVYNKNMWKVGFRRGLTIEVDRDIQKRQLIMVVSFRIAIGAYGTRASNYHTTILYNLTV